MDGGEDPRILNGATGLMDPLFTYDDTLARPMIESPLRNHTTAAAPPKEPLFHPPHQNRIKTPMPPMVVDLSELTRFPAEDQDLGPVAGGVPDPLIFLVGKTEIRPQFPQGYPHRPEVGPHIPQAPTAARHPFQPVHLRDGKTEGGPDPSEKRGVERQGPDNLWLAQLVKAVKPPLTTAPESAVDSVKSLGGPALPVDLIDPPGKGPGERRDGVFAWSEGTSRRANIQVSHRACHGI